MCLWGQWGVKLGNDLVKQFYSDNSLPGTEKQLEYT